ncbi:hypothetical protein [Arcticibacter svalbardensis]|nr:hypothetical protein [Arcticibacter svalbardensis]
MIYEQNGKSILVIKSSLTAFEGEVDYTFGKAAYKTPEEFNQLVIRHFQKNCFVIANGDTIKFSNIQVQLGHETTLFAELINMPKKITTFYVSCALFKDMSDNRCELILTDIGGQPQKQYILNNSNRQTVMLKTENKKWVVVETDRPFNLSITYIIGAAILLIASLIVFIAIKGKH